jgi:hypothetical protein
MFHVKLSRVSANIPRMARILGLFIGEAEVRQHMVGLNGLTLP